jgi:hypothetical protein
MYPLEVLAVLAMHDDSRCGLVREGERPETLNATMPDHVYRYEGGL